MNIIEVQNVSMVFNLLREPVFSLKEYVISFLKGRVQVEEFVALSNVSFEIKKGEVFGIVGDNGSGKSTLLKLIAGVYKATDGKVSVYGKVAPLIELGAGFDMDLTARENIFLNGLILGYTREYIIGKFDEIVAFSEIGDFIDVPLKNYSSGMVSRIAFSIATCTQPDILIADEILSVGDFEFQAKCENRIMNMMAKGTTVIFVSHSIDQVKRICKRAAWLDHGKIVTIGDVDFVCDAYINKIY